MPEILGHKIPEPEPGPQEEEPYGKTPRGEIGLEKKKKKKKEDILEHKIPDLPLSEQGPYGGTPRGEIGLEEAKEEEPAARKEQEDRIALPPHEERPPEKPIVRFERRKKAVFADISDVIEQEARDAAATAMTEEREKLKGFKGALKRFWKHSFLDGYYRSRELHKARQKIQETKNIYVAEEADQKASDDAKSAIMERFADEHTKEMLGEGEEKEFHNDLKNEVLTAVNEYARTGDDNAWQARCAQILEKAAQKHNLKGNDMLESVNYVNNLYKIAQETRQAYLLGEKEGRAQEALLEDIEIIWGKAKSSVRTEAQFNRLDRVIDKVEKSRVTGRITGIFGNEFAVAAGLSIAYCLARKPLEAVLRTRAAKWATFGAGVAVTAGLAGARESHRIEAERRAHFRDRAKGKTFEKGKAPRREEMEKFRYDTLGSDYLMESMQGLYKKYDPKGERELRALNNTEKEAALKLLTEIESRTKLMDEHKIDLIHYSTLGKVEKERYKLNLLRAQLKVDLRKSDPRGFDQKLETAANTNADFLLKEGDESILEKDRLFKKMKRGKVAKTVCKVMATGLVFGALAQEAGAFVSKKQEGLVEGLIKGRTKGERLTALAKLKEVIAGDTTKGEIGWVKNFNVGEKAFKVTLPQGADLIDPEGDGIFKLIYNGKDVYDGISFNPNGTIAKESIAALAQKGIHIDESYFETVKGYAAAGGLEGKTAREEFIDKNSGLFQRVKRILWYDNDTPKPLFDKNELKLWWGGVKGMGLNENGDFVFNIKQMRPDGSYHTPHTIDAQQAMKAGKLKMLLSLSKDTQNNVFEVQIQPNGDAIIPKNSEIAQVMFEKGADGKAIFLGKYAEVAEVVGKKAKDGRDMMRILATHVGEETGKAPKVPVPEKLPIPIFELPRTRPEDLPPFIPVFGRYPLEKAKRGAPPEAPPSVFPLYPYYGAGSERAVLQEFESRRIPLDPYVKAIKQEKAALRHENGEKIMRDVGRENKRIQEYLDSQNPQYREELESLNNTLLPMEKKCRVAVIVPARFEAKNLANLLDQYAEQKDSKGNPVDTNLFEVNIILNKKDSEQWDNSKEVVEQWKKTHPDIRVSVIEKSFDNDKACVGLARKYITDLSLLRSVSRPEQDGPLYIESEDADLFSVDQRTAHKLIKDFDKDPTVDVLRGLQDRQPEILMQNDLLFFQRRLWDFMEVFLRHPKYRPENNPEADFVWHRVVSGGWNTAYTAEAYSQIGGYNPTMRIGEDMDIGQKISVLRGHKDIKTGLFVPSTITAKPSGLRSNSSPRRFIDALARRISPYDDFENQALKTKSIEELMGRIKEYAEAKPAQLGKYQESIDIAVGFLKDTFRQKTQEWQAVIEHTLTFLGLQPERHYLVSEKGVTLKPEGMKEIMNRLAEYKRKKHWQLGYRRQTRQP